MKNYCSNCESMQNTLVQKVHQKIEVKETFVEVDVTILTCQKCGEEIYDRKTEITNDIIVFDAYKIQKQMMDSKSLICLRKKYGTSQETLSKILGFGLKTITRYENGTIQDVTHDNLLRLIEEDINNFILLWEKRKSELSNIENKKIQKALDAMNKNKYDYPSKHCDIKYETNNNRGDNYAWC